MNLPDDGLVDVFGPAEEKTRGRPKRRIEETTVISFNVPESVAELGHAKTRENHGVLTKYLTLCYVRFIEGPIDDIRAVIERFEYNRGVTIETLTAGNVHHDRAAGTERLSGLRLAGGEPVAGTGGGHSAGPQADETLGSAPAETGPSKAVA